MPDMRCKRAEYEYDARERDTYTGLGRTAYTYSANFVYELRAPNAVFGIRIRVGEAGYIKNPSTCRRVSEFGGLLAKLPLWLGKN
jgi:hypothetical protein